MPADAEAEVLAAHDARDGAALMRLYGAEGDRLAAAGQEGAACFLWTQAYVWGLEAGEAGARAYHARLKARGREE